MQSVALARVRVRRIAGRIKRAITARLRPPISDAIPLSLIAKHLPANPVVLEAGAHRGFDTIALARTWPQGTVHAFEPIPELFEALTERTRDCSNVERYALALAGESGTAEMWVSGGAMDQSSSLRTPRTHLEELPDITFDRKITVRTVSLDDWASSRGEVDALWLDLQGSELDALRGGERLLSSVNVICAEVHVTELYEGVPMYPEIRAWLEDRGFVVKFENLPWNGAGNVLFVRPSVAR